MDNKNAIVEYVKQWVKLDNEMRQLRDEVTSRRKLKENISNSLLNLMKNNEIDSFDIKNGRLESTTRTTKKPISKKMLQNILSKYYKGDDAKANELNNFILENREEVSKEVLTRKVDKN
jgi:DNA-directed RNA polymerase subunit F|tara:strand:- start:825 stop:1181 length:357 start_codon:yes stop_codon:yes gene_type:complete